MPRPEALTPSFRTAVAVAASIGLLAPAACQRGATTAEPEPAPAADVRSVMQQTAAADAEAPRTDIPELAVPRGVGIRIDGRLDEPAWAHAATTGPFVAPGDGTTAAASPVQASARLLWDDDALYVALFVADAEPHGDNARDDVDPHVWATASGIELMLQPGDHGDNQHYFEVQVDTNEAVWDTRFDDYNRPITGDGAERRFGHQEWDAQLERTAIVGDGGYVIEFALPWTALHAPRAATPPAVGDVWRANLYSFRDGQRHALAWSPLLGEGNFHRASRFGRLRFVAGS